MRRQQRGVTFVGMVFIAGLIVVGAILALKLVPAYIEYATITNTLRDLARTPEARSGSPRDLQMAFNKRAQIDEIRVVTGEDVEVTKEGDQVVLTAAFSTKVKLFGNLSACIDFVATSAP
jgi:hypothetical protein